jgi:4-hydroxy-3-methylbut-2-enyl diphosphate reductase
MEVVRSKVMGYCAGVVRVIKLAEEALRLAEEGGANAYSIGWFIHNPTVVKRFEERGMRHINHPSEGEGGVALIRAHGIGDSLREAFLQGGYTLVDGTCKTVVYSQELIRDSNPSENIVIIGQKDHSEVIALSNVYRDGKVIETTIVEDPSEVDQLNGFEDQSLLVVVQTTFSQSSYEAILEKLQRRYTNRLRVGNSLCPTTYRRHSALLEVCQEVEAVVVVGGKMSANTTALTQLVAEYGLPVWHVESYKEIPLEVYSFSRVGVTAGASTPSEDIEEVVTHLEEGVVG